jgi:hypothetical protein
MGFRLNFSCESGKIARRSRASWSRFTSSMRDCRRQLQKTRFPGICGRPFMRATAPFESSPASLDWRRNRFVIFSRGQRSLSSEVLDRLARAAGIVVTVSRGL